MFSQTRFKTVTFLSAYQWANSSTESHDSDLFRRLKSNAKQRNKVRVSGEVCLRTKAWHGREAQREIYAPVEAFGERKESAICALSQAEIPNRKERLNSAIPLLLNPANTSEIGLFADQRRQQNAAADEVVMDRGAECTAGGCDAI